MEADDTVVLRRARRGDVVAFAVRWQDGRMVCTGRSDQECSEMFQVWFLFATERAYAFLARPRVAVSKKVHATQKTFDKDIRGKVKVAVRLGRALSRHRHLESARVHHVPCLCLFQRKQQQPVYLAHLGVTNIDGSFDMAWAWCSEILDLSLILTGLQTWHTPLEP